MPNVGLGSEIFFSTFVLLSHGEALSKRSGRGAPRTESI